LDLGGRWQATKQWLLSGRIANVTDRSPALRMEASGILLGVDTRYANYYGRTFSLKAQYKF
jgi:outer membrane receptor protein involved in Fe transport